MYLALRQTLDMVRNSRDNKGERETWIVCLTDGQSADSADLVRHSVQQSSADTHLVVIGVNLSREYEDDMCYLCDKFERRSNRHTKGFYVPSGASVDGLRDAFAAVASRIPVSQTFELDGELTNRDCERLIQKYAPESLENKDMLQKSFWVRFLYRRVKVMDNNERFNYNESHESLGSSLMTTMLGEVARLLDTNQKRDLVSTNHAQLIYDFTVPDAPEFRLICTSPQSLSEERKREYEGLDMPGFFVPTEAHLRKRETLDCYLSQALGVKLHEKSNGERHLRCIDEEGFVLTLDFTIKLLSIHERVACRVPCIIEGETGVSKTALTKMYGILQNSASREQACSITATSLSSIESSLQEEGYTLESGSCPRERLLRSLERAAESTIGGETQLSLRLNSLLIEHCSERSCLFAPVPSKYATDGNTSVVRDFLDWFCCSELEPTFFEINVDSSYRQDDFVSTFKKIRAAARKLLASDCLLVVFLDGELYSATTRGAIRDQ